MIVLLNLLKIYCMGVDRRIWPQIRSWKTTWEIWLTTVSFLIKLLSFLSGWSTESLRKWATLIQAIYVSDELALDIIIQNVLQTEKP